MTKEMTITENVEDLTKRYEALTIQEIEEKADLDKRSAINHQAAFIEKMFYLQRTNRFRENPVYKKSSFETYLTSKWNMRFSGYMSDKVAYLNFPKETKYIGAGDVNRIRKSCGDLKVPKIVEEIKQVESKRKTPLSHEQRQEIIKKYERPRTDTENREESIRYLKAENERLWNILKDERRSYQEHLTELEKENQKLKTAIKKYHKQRAA